MRVSREVTESRLHSGVRGRAVTNSQASHDEAGLRLYDANVLRFVALLASSDIELDAVTLIQRLVAVTNDVGEVDEHVVSLGTGNEAVTLFRVEELHRTFCHCYSSHVPAG